MKKLALCLSMAFFLSVANSAYAVTDCNQELVAAGLNPGRLSAGDSGHLPDGIEIVVAKNEGAPQVCARIAAMQIAAGRPQSELSDMTRKLAATQAELDKLNANPLKEGYLWFIAATFILGMSTAALASLVFGHRRR